ncbi:MAG TPA: DUF1559 domain-containing protein, partial [Pirellulaceae bacterium]|nr:DUF1559 domain-containing protein [Pirellulaceae bacterium]
MFRYCYWLFAVALLLSAQSLFAQESTAEASAAAIAPFVDAQTIAIGRLDLTKLDLPATFKTVRQFLPADLIERDGEKLAGAEAEVTKSLASVREAGCQQLFLVVSLADVPQRAPLLVAILDKNADASRFAEQFKAAFPPLAELESAVVRGQPCLGEAATIERLKTTEPVAPRREIAAAFALAGDDTAQMILVPTEDARRVVSETLTSLPPQLSDMTGKQLAAAVQYAAIGLNLPPKLSVRAVVKSNNEASATQLEALLTNGLKLAGELPPVREVVEPWDKFSELLKPQRAGDRVTMQITSGDQTASLAMLLAKPVQAARAAAQRSQSMNNLKQMALAMHNFHDAHRTFPAAQLTKDGKPLLSWRVQILPYIEQQPLYEQFKLDEPWDSEHNIKLVDKMPKIFNNPSVTLKPGLTNYLLPVGKDLVFHGDEKTKLEAITDGTSNTLMIVEANPDQAVIWTKPDDLPVDLDKPLAGLGEAQKNGFLAVLCDGSVRFI